MGELVDKGHCALIAGEAPVKIELWSTAGPRQSLGQPLQIVVRVTNVTDGPILMVGVLPGSEGQRYPQYVAEIEGPAGRVHTRFPEALDYVRGLRTEDFVRLAPGESFDPQGQGFIPIQPFVWFRATEPGTYWLRLCFDATVREAHAWLGHSVAGDPQKLETLIGQVPPVRVWSNTLEIEFE